jgi:hypothetical protein
VSLSSFSCNSAAFLANRVGRHQLPHCNFPLAALDEPVRVGRNDLPRDVSNDQS